MRPSARRLVALALLAGSASGCNVWYNDVPSPDALLAAVPWFDHMVASQAVWPYSRIGIPRTTPPGTVPVTGGEVDWSAEWATGNTATADRQANPTNGVPTARGDTLYHTFCAVCHGVAGAGNGPVGPKVAAPSLLTPRAMAYTDGYIYSILRYGRGIMGKYGDKITEQNDRWQVVNYTRQLQAASRQTGGQ
ncbi:MAG TPA: cytochrome c [Gemmatimonadales bacterium]|nr:cytochrome c [Gemmatimonadales bacterium]